MINENFINIKKDSRWRQVDIYENYQYSQGRNVDANVHSKTEEA
jgi:hypothetical protein